MIARTLLAVMLATAGANAANRNSHDVAMGPELARRAADWRNGAVVYQVMVDRFAPPADLVAKQKLYAPPRKLRPWSDTPTAGTFAPEAQVWRHELDFWGGDLKSLQGRLPYLKDLGADVLYLNPIFTSLTNHKYDAWDFHTVDPALGSRADLRRLADALHGRRMRLMLDGVFNHMGRQSPMFQAALKNPNDPHRSFFKWRPGAKVPYVGWLDVANLPELNLEDRRVRDFLYNRRDSVLQSYVRREGIDGWRLDVAFDLGFNRLREMNAALQAAKPGASLVGEVWNYPAEWFPALDGVMNMHGRAVVLGMLDGRIRPETAAGMWETMVADAGVAPLLKSWLVMDNHDTPRLATRLPERWQWEMARVLQFTLPGSPCMFYGSEAGMTGGGDPEMRAPMRWDLAQKSNPTWAFHKRLIGLHKAEPALRYGDFRRLQADGIFAFLRHTASVRQAVVVLANPNSEPISTLVQLRESKFQDDSTLVDVFDGKRFQVLGGMVDVALPAHGTRVLKMDTRPYPNGYERYDRLY